jgi:hypothetical protein
MVMQRPVGFAALLCLCLCLASCASLRVDIPEYEAPGKVVQLEQGWTGQQWFQFHHTPQGTRLLRYDWFVALEQPCLSLFECDLFSDATYLARFGFLASKKDPKLNPGGLPVGFARQQDFTDPETGESYPVVGLTCAACHTGELRFDEYAVRIEGGPAMIEVAQFQKALGLALVLTQKIPGRFGRFAGRVLGENASDKDRAALTDKFNRVLEAGLAERDAADQRKIYDNPAGFARTDALARIGNQVFAVDMKNDDNLAPANAAVRFPQIWDASWLSWVQYNSSIADPLVRNIGESLGVRAAAKLYGPDALEFRNSVNLPGLRVIEDLLSGPAPFEGLRSPHWPSVFPPLDQAKVAEGARLYKLHCEKCHLPPVEELQADLASNEPRYWRGNSLGVRLLKVKDIKVDFVGTDPLQAMDFIRRTADTGDLGKGTVSAAEGLSIVTGAIARKFFEMRGIPPEEQLDWRGRRDPEEPVARAEPIYKARPLDGIWAVAPFLHNGSIPDLYALLSPQQERPATFWLGSKRFDPKRVGYENSELKGGYLYDTSRPGNSNKGHEFRDGPQGNGVIGPALAPEYRWALIEYLKSL